MASLPNVGDLVVAQHLFGVIVGPAPYLGTVTTVDTYDPSYPFKIHCRDGTSGWSAYNGWRLATPEELAKHQLDLAGLEGL